MTSNFLADDRLLEGRRNTFTGQAGRHVYALVIGGPQCTQSSFSPMPICVFSESFQQLPRQFPTSRYTLIATSFPNVGRSGWGELRVGSLLFALSGP